MREVKGDSRGSMLGWYWRTSQTDNNNTSVDECEKDRNLERRSINTAWSSLYALRNTLCRTFTLKKPHWQNIVWLSSVCRLAVSPSVCTSQRVSHSQTALYKHHEILFLENCKAPLLRRMHLILRGAFFFIVINPILFYPMITAACLGPVVKHSRRSGQFQLRLF